MQMHGKSAVLLAALLSIPAIAPIAAHAAETEFSKNNLPSSTIRQTFLDRRYQDVIRQQSDYSCGAATMATLMTFYFKDRKTELEVLDTLRQGLSEDEQRDRTYAGFSLLDMKRAAEQLGYKAAGYRLTLEQLKKVSAPVIVHTAPMGYKHFAVLRTIVGNRVLLADPSRGNLRMSIDRFLDEWSGVVFVMGKPGEKTLNSKEFTHPNKRDNLPNKQRWYRQLERRWNAIDLL